MDIYTRVVKKLRRLLLTDQNGLLYSNEIYNTSIPYLSPINSENFMYLAWICVKLWLIEDTHQRCPGARQ